MSIDTFVVNEKTGKATITKDPDAVLDYTFDWTAWLDSVTDSISTHTAVVTSGVTPASNVAVDGSSVVGKTVVVWVSGGVVGETVALRCRIDTAGNRIDDRTVYLKIKER